jgi:hypothetical protein
VNVSIAQWLVTRGSESRGSPTPQSDRTAPYYRRQVSSPSHPIKWGLASPLLRCRSCCFDVAVAVAVDVDVDVVSINLIDSTMEPIFAKFASETVLAELRAELDSAIVALPPPQSDDMQLADCSWLRNQLLLSSKNLKACHLEW